MEWVLIMSLQWVIGNAAPAPIIHTDLSFPSQEMCEAAAEKIRAEMKASIQGAVTHARLVCVQTK